ncbi:LOW QUALITY PROTEIN: polyprotein, partial [Phytophthora megakarya]
MTTTKKAEVLLGSGNYFHWEYNMRMTLARKGLLSHVEVVKQESEETEAWLTRDAKALGIIAQGVELQPQTKLRSVSRAMQAWSTFREYYNRTTLHNRVTLTRRLHEFKMENGSTMSKHLDAFDELVVGLQTLGEPVDEARQLVVLLSSLPAEYELISSIVENAQDVTLNDVKEKLLKEYERLEKKETTERAFKVNAGQFKGGRAYDRNPRNNSGGFKGKLFKCNRVGHLKRDCPEQNGASGNDEVFS